MLGDCRIELRNVRYRKIRSEKPACAENPDSLARTALRGAVDKYAERYQSQDRQILDAYFIPPISICAPRVRIHHGTFHVQIPGKNHQSRVIAKTACH